MVKEWLHLLDNFDNWLLNYWQYMKKYSCNGADNSK